MKLLFDQNLSYRLCQSQADVFPGAAQVAQVALDRAADDIIWSFARREGFVIVTLDADFAEIAAWRGAPPKIVWLRCGNRPTGFMQDLLCRHGALIADFVENSDAACLELY